MNIAIIGSGVSGLMAAYVLQRQHTIDVFEKDAWIGGHAHTVDAPGDDGDQPVDTGFIVYNEVNYPHFTRLLAELNVPTIASDMSFAVFDPLAGMAYSSRGFSGLFASKRNLMRPGFLRMIRDILRFNRSALNALESNSAHGLTLGEFLKNGGYSAAFIRWYIAPMSSAIWSAAGDNTLGFPAETFFRFFKNHGLLSISPDIPWRTVQGGSRAYVNALTRSFRDRIHLNTPVRSVRRSDEGVWLHFDDGPDRRYDRVVIAAHADQALQLLADPTPEEKKWIGLFPYQHNRVALHNDSGILPSRERARASWNVRIHDTQPCAERPVTLTYLMNRLQQIPGDHNYLVTLNPPSAWRAAMAEGAAGKSVWYETVYEHPVFTAEGFGAQADLRAWNGAYRTVFAGAYLGYGFHEDGLVSGLEAARRLGADWPL